MTSAIAPPHSGPFVEPALHQPRLSDSGVYRTPEVARVLGIPAKKVGRYIREMLREQRRSLRASDGPEAEPGRGSRILVTSPLFVELFRVLRLHDEGLHMRNVLAYRERMIRDLEMPYPFAYQELLTDGKAVWFRYMDGVVRADGKRQIAFRQMIEPSARALEAERNPA